MNYILGQIKIKHNKMSKTDLDNTYTLRDGLAALWDASIIDTLPEHKRDGSIFFNDNL